MKKILFVEDESALQETFKDFLNQEGYQMVSALDGEIGLRLAKTEKPDLILLDLILPKKDGFEVLEELKKEEGTKDIPVIVLTHLEEMEDVQRAIELGARDYLVKANYSLKEVVEKIKKALESWNVKHEAWNPSRKLRQQKFSKKIFANVSGFKF